MLNYFKTLCSSVFLLGIGSCSFPVNDYMDDLGGGYTFVSESNQNQFVSGPSDSLNVYTIPCTVKAVDANEDFIIASQINTPECDGVNDPSHKLRYWIIRKADGRSYGPLDSLAYLEHRRYLK